MKALLLAALLAILLMFLLPPHPLRAQDVDPGQEAVAAYRKVATGLAQDRPVALWDGLPPTQQAGIATMLKKCATQIDAASWRAGFQSIEKMGATLSHKQHFVRGSRVAGGLLSISSETRSPEPWFRIGPLLIELGRSPIGDPVQLGKLDVGAFMEREGRVVSAKLPDLSQATRGSLDELIAQRARYIGTEVSPLKVESPARVLLMLLAPDGEVEEAWFVKSEGKWMPERQLQEWPQTMEKAEARCAEFAREGGTVKWIKTLGEAREAFGKLASSKSQPEFDAGMGAIADAVGPELAQMALDSMLGDGSIGGIKLNVGKIILTPKKEGAAGTKP